MPTTDRVIDASALPEAERSSLREQLREILSDAEEIGPVGPVRLQVEGTNRATISLPEAVARPLLNLLSDLAECYSSLTALPVSPAVTPGRARRLIEENVAEAAEEIVRLGGSEYLEVLQRMADLGLESGAVYDALHVYCAEKASADELRTFNGMDFRRMPSEGATELVVL